MTICHTVHKILRSKETVTICSIKDPQCYQVQYEPGQWSDDYNHKVMDKAKEVDLEAIKRGESPRFSHGFCPEHYANYLQEIDMAYLLTRK